MTAWRGWATETAQTIETAGRWRTLLPFDAAGVAGTVTRPDGSAQEVVSFASNDYLGLSQHGAVAQAAHEAIRRWGTGSGASRLVVGSRPIHHQLENALARWKHTDATVLFPTGFVANLGVLSVFGGASVAIISDELNHASIIDGCRLARGDTSILRHADVEALRSHLGSQSGNGRRVMVVTDVVFSMDGDVAPLLAIGEACAEFGALLVVDEAHDVFHEADVLRSIDNLDVLHVGTLSKTLGSLGGFVAGPGPLIDLLVNQARPFIFTTAPTPADSAAAMAALQISVSAEGDGLRQRLRHHIQRLRDHHPSPILPVILGEERTALAASAELLEQGLWVPAIRPPTVAAGTSRLRVALSAAHSDAHITALTEALTRVDRRHHMGSH